MRVNYSIEGARELEALLKTLGPNVARKVGVQAARAGAKPVLEEAKRRVPVDTGDLKSSLTIMTASKTRKDERAVLIGVRGEAGGRAHFTEYGSAHSAAKPFMRPALDSQVGAALNEMGRALGDGIEREAEALSKSPR